MVNVLIAGDYCPQDRISSMIKEGDFSFLDFAKQYTKSADYSIVNLECPIVERDYEPISKCGRNLKCSAEALNALKEAGFSAVTLANNHLKDYGDKAVIDTLRRLDDYDLDYVGGGVNLSDSQKVLLKTICGKTIAILNFCENEFSIATPTTAGAAPLDLVDNQRQIAWGGVNADYQLVIVHGGNEMYNLPNPQMQKIYRWFIDNGADAVINHHQHCYSGYEVYKGKPIFYGLGNFCFDKPTMRKSQWNYGYMVNIKFDEIISFDLIPYVQCSELPMVLGLDDVQHLEFRKTIEELNKIISSPLLIAQKFEEYCNICSRSTLSVFMPYSNRYLRWAAKKYILPTFLNRSKLAHIYDYINCEAHRFVVIETLKTLLLKHGNS